MKHPLIWLAVFLISPVFGQQKPNFTGTWKLDLQLTRFNQVEPPKSLILEIEHKEPQIRINTKTETKAGAETSSIEVATDSQPRQSSVEGHATTALAHWDQWSGQRLVWTITRETPEGTIEVTRRAKLGDKGKIMTTVATIRTAKGEKKYNEFFVRQ